VEQPVTSTFVRFGFGGVRDLSSSLSRQAVLVATVCLLVDGAAFLLGQPITRFGTVEWAVLAAIVVVDAALALPARLSGWVALAHAVAAVAAAALLAASGGNEASSAGTLIAGYRAGAWLRGGAAYVALAVLTLGVGTARVVSGVHNVGFLAVEVVKDAVLPWLVGRYTTARRAYLAELEQRAENQRREAESAVEHAVAEERSAIARDLHDVISHHVSAIGVHAGAARMSLDTATRPAGIADSLSAVEMSSRSAMADLRRLLDILHGDTSNASGQPGLDNLEDLLDGVRRAGLPTRLTTLGVARPLPGSVDIALYRITQEMLTNALRHGDGTPVEIELSYLDTSVSVTARNAIPQQTQPAPTGRRAARQQLGHARGLTGIRKRAAMFEGTITYGPDDTGRHWVTTATFPLGGER
jgi:signal transduction histidine kinase